MDRPLFSNRAQVARGAQRTVKSVGVNPHSTRWRVRERKIARAYRQGSSNAMFFCSCLGSMSSSSGASIEIVTTRQDQCNAAIHPLTLVAYIDYARGSIIPHNPGVSMYRSYWRPILNLHDIGEICTQ
jgi:hypothetical protein